LRLLDLLEFNQHAARKPAAYSTICTGVPANC
jgi:hypothetical protein